MQGQICIVYMVRYSLNDVSWKQRKEVATDLKAICSAPTVEKAEYHLERFEEKWNARHPTIGKSWRSSWERITPLFSYPKEIRRGIYTTNAIESVNISLRKVTKNRGSSQNNESMIKLMYLTLQNIAKKWTVPIHNWRSALNQFSIMFEGRMPLLKPAGHLHNILYRPKTSYVSVLLLPLPTTSRCWTHTA